MDPVALYPQSTAVESPIMQYLGRGFASMNKHDLEVWISHTICLLPHFRGKSNCCMHGIPPRRYPPAPRGYLS